MYFADGGGFMFLRSHLFSQLSHPSEQVGHGKTSPDILSAETTIVAGASTPVSRNIHEVHDRIQAKLANRKQLQRNIVKSTLGDTHATSHDHLLIEARLRHAGAYQNKSNRARKVQGLFEEG